MKNYSNCCKSLRCALHASCFCWFHACIDKTCHWIWVFIFSGTVSWLQCNRTKKFIKLLEDFMFGAPWQAGATRSPGCDAVGPQGLPHSDERKKLEIPHEHPRQEMWTVCREWSFVFVSMKKLRSTNLSFWRNETDLSLSCVKGQGTHFKVGCGNRAGNCTATT